jgi:microcystin-dependent protein
MAEPFVGQIMAVSFPFAPNGWASCTGQLLQVSQNQALFALMGAQFGSTSPNDFNLPNCAGRTIIGSGTDAWSVQHEVGMGTTGPVSIGLNNLPTHSHDAVFTPGPSPAPSSVTLNASLNLALNGALSGGLGGRNASGGDATPNDNDVLGQAGINIYVSSTAGTAVPLKTLSLQGTLTGTLNTSLPVTVSAPGPPAVTLQPAGSGTTVPLTAPYIVQSVIIAMTGLWPSRP